MLHGIPSPPRKHFFLRQQLGLRARGCKNHVHAPACVRYLPRATSPNASRRHIFAVAQCLRTGPAQCAVPTHVTPNP